MSASCCITQTTAPADQQQPHADLQQHMSAPLNDRELTDGQVGPGTGISPIMGFLQARAQALRTGRVPSLAPCLVYFGCRDSSETLYAEQMRRWVEEGVITELHVAMSREGPKVRRRALRVGRQASLSAAIAPAFLTRHRPSMDHGSWIGLVNVSDPAGKALLAL